ncbi:hypothetical protein BGW80DRAFT_1128496, partial [Lactifluus volemus]
NFKDATFKNAAITIGPYLESGPSKQAKHCRMKWQQLKSISTTIERLKDASGMHWDNVHGANIEGDDAGAVWDTYVGKNPHIKPFRNSGWEYY